MTQALDALPTWVTAVLVVGVWMALSGLGVALARPWVESRLGDRHHDVVVPLFLATATMYAIVVAFMVVVVWQRYADAEASDRHEATVLVALYRETLSMPAPLGGHLRGHLRDYTNAVIDREWPVQGQGGTSPAVQESLDQIYRDYLTRAGQQTGRPEVYQEFLANLDRLAELRANRVLTSRSSLPATLSFGLIAGGVLTIANSALFIMQRRALQVLAAVLMGAMIGLLLFVIMVLNQPYSGGVSLGPDDFRYALTVYGAVDADASAPSG
jgi:hypothetical protein